MGLWESITNLPAEISTAFIGSFSGLLAGFIQPLLDSAKVLLTANIDPFHFQAQWQVIVSIISAFYLLLFLVVALKFLFGCYDAVQRSDAKEWLKKAILLVVSVNASLLLYSLVLSVSSAVAVSLWSQDFEKIFVVNNLAVMDIIGLTILAVFLFSALVTLVLRQVFLIFGVMLFPIALFLYFIPPLKPFGSVALNVIGVVAFMNVLDVIILLAMSLFLSEFDYLVGVSLLGPSLGFLFIAIANVGIAWIGIQKGLGAVGVKVGLGDIAKSLAGPAKAVV